MVSDDLEIELRLARIEYLMDRRPLLLNRSDISYRTVYFFNKEYVSLQQYNYVSDFCLLRSNQEVNKCSTLSKQQI